MRAARRGPKEHISVGPGSFPNNTMPGELFQCSDCVTAALVLLGLHQCHSKLILAFSVDSHCFFRMAGDGGISLVTCMPKSES